MGHFFDSDTEVTPGADGIYSAEMTDRWTALHGTPLGSYGLAVGVRALAQQMPHSDPLSVSAYFLRPIEVGQTEMRTESVRKGRRMSFGQVTLSQGGEEKLRAIATFADLPDLDGPASSFGDAPQLPPPDECVDPLAGLSMPGITLLDRVEYRTTEVPGWLRGDPGATPARDFWMRLRDGREPDPLALTFLWDAMSPMVPEIGRARPRPWRRPSTSAAAPPRAGWPAEPPPATSRAPCAKKTWTSGTRQETWWPNPAN